MTAPLEVQVRWGHFVGEVHTRWLRERGGDRRMEVTRPVAFVRATGERIQVEPGFIFDGASIPRVLWAAVGSPLHRGLPGRGRDP